MTILKEDSYKNSYENKNNINSIRRAVVAGQFYENSFEELNNQIEACFKSTKGFGELPIYRRLKKIIGVISPHAGYFFSGACASCSYMEIAESEFPEAYVILGPNHYGFETGLSEMNWITPFGIVKTHKDLIKEICEKTDLKINENAHVFEHSIEVQLPFLQFATRDKINDLRIVPIGIGKDIDFIKIGKQLWNVLKDKKVIFIVSSDFTHYGRNYRYLPFTNDIKNNIYNLDKGAIEIIKKLDIKGFQDYLDKTGITICGFMPILVFMSILKEIEIYRKDKIKSELLMHYTSGDIIVDYKNSVSYVSMVFR